MSLVFGFAENEAKPKAIKAPLAEREDHKQEIDFRAEDDLQQSSQVAKMKQIDVNKDILSKEIERRPKWSKPATSAHVSIFSKTTAERIRERKEREEKEKSEQLSQA